MQSTGTETWLPVPGAERDYKVSDTGLIWSRRRHGSQGGVVRQSTTPAGHRVIGITIDGIQRMRLVHRIVALAFIGQPPARSEVRHLNGVPSDNRVENLIYGTRSENVLDQVAHGVHNNASKTHCKNGHEFTVENTMKRSGGGRRCRTCNNISQARYRASRA